MAESLVASAIQWIGSSLMQESGILLEVEDKVRNLQTELRLMQQYLQDADSKHETKEITDTLIMSIRKLAYDAEDVIDTYILKVGAKANVLGHKGCFIKYAWVVYTAPQIYSIGKQIQLLQNNAKQITATLTNHGVLRQITMGGQDFTSSSDREKQRNKRRSYPYNDDDAEYIVGLDKDIKTLLEVLLGEGKTQVHVVSIVGMGGLGKSTLARELYNHPYTKECFDCRAWVCISQEWSSRHVLSELLKKVSDPTEESKMNAEWSEVELVDKLRSILEKKSYLVVLDDVWRKEALEQILPALPRMNNDKGSKIVITTRNQEVVRFSELQRHLHVHEPRPLNKDESWELFCKIVFYDHTNYSSEGYKDLGKEMLQKCDGLPLAIVALAGILNTKKSISEWQQVSEAVRTRVIGTTTLKYGKVGEMLSLSYDDIPCDLKPCFLYLGVFPEDCQIPAGMLTRMWIAEGLVTSNDETSQEDDAMQCLEKLSHRFLIQVVRTNFEGAIKAIQMHDLLRQLCITKAREQFFLQIDTPINNSTDNDGSNIQPRKLALHFSTYFPTQVSKLRSIVMLPTSSIMHSGDSAYVPKEIAGLENLHHKFKLLRLLNLWGIKTLDGTLPTQIGSLVNLRYLGIRASNITELPESIGKLKYLLTLDYRNIKSGNNVKVPAVLCKLMLLRHLFLPIKRPWSGTLENLQLSPLKNLQILWGVKGDGGEWFSREIPNLSATVKKLKVTVFTENDLEAAFSCPSLVHDQLHTFHCEWSASVALRMIRGICHNQHLHKLVLSGKIQVEELSRILPSKLSVLELRDSVLEDEDPMIVIGALAHLKLLRLSNSYMGEAMTCNLGSFPQLEVLYLENLENLGTWEIEKGAMSSLKKLEIFSCKKLHQFPQGLAFVTTLQHLEYFRVPKEFEEQAKVYGWSQQRRLRLPHNFEAIVEQCDTPLDMSSVQKFQEELITGIFLNNKTKKFWVVKHEDHQYNCFMLYSHPANRQDPGNDYLSVFDSYGLRREEESSDGACIIVAKQRYDALVMTGRFTIAELSPLVTYTFSVEVMLEDTERGEQVVFQTELQNAASGDQKTLHTLTDKPSNEWFTLLIGKVETHPNNAYDLPGYLKFWCIAYGEGTLKVKGVIIEPKL